MLILKISKSDLSFCPNIKLCKNASVSKNITCQLKYLWIFERIVKHQTGKWLAMIGWVHVIFWVFDFCVFNSTNWTGEKIYVARLVWEQIRGTHTLVELTVKPLPNLSGSITSRDLLKCWYVTTTIYLPFVKLHFISQCKNCWEIWEVLRGWRLKG